MTQLKRMPGQVLSGPVRRRLAAVLLAAAWGCDGETESFTAPEPAALSTASTGPLAFRQVSTGDEHACGVTTENRAFCWGNSLWGQLGHGISEPEAIETRPVAVQGGLRFSQVSAGNGHSCGITTDSRAYCWGRNFEGQLGDGTQTGRLEPVPVAGTRRFRQVQAGSSYSCAITLADVAFCWGHNAQGQLGDGTTTSRLTPVRVAGGLIWRQLSAAANGLHACGVTTANRGYCWGGNGPGTLGDGTRISRLRPVAVSGGLFFRQIDVGSAHTCAVTTEYRPYCWGTSSKGALGDNSTTVFTRLTPTKVFGLRLFDHVSAGSNHTCGVTRARVGFCWGYNGVGQLGNGTTTDQRRPTQLAGGLSLAQISASQGFSCGVTTGNAAYCWGVNHDGQLGDGTQENRRVPTAVEWEEEMW